MVLFFVEDVFYSITHYELMPDVEESIDTFGFVAFSSFLEIASDSSLELLCFCIMPTFATFERNPFFAQEWYTYWVERCTCTH